jgi:uncharacterized phage protein (TIGR02220 family)
MEKLQWFKFSPSDYMMGKIQRCPEITQARFIRLCCLYWNKECNLNITDTIIEIDQEHFDILISKKIISSNEEHIFIDFLDEQMLDITETSKDKSKAAKIRWAKYNEEKNNADAMHVHTDAMQNDAEKRREEERREEKNNKADKIDFDALILFINKTFGRSFKKASSAVKAKYNARLKDGYTKEDFKTAITNCSKNKFHIDNNFQYCTPEYFSRSEVIDKYSNVTEQEPEQETIFDPRVEAMKLELQRYNSRNQ